MSKGISYQQHRRSRATAEDATASSIEDARA